MIEYKPKALKDLNKLDKQTVSRIRKEIQKLDNTPMQGDIKALHGELKGLYRLRIGNYRVIFEVNNNTVTILNVFDRKQAYN